MVSIKDASVFLASYIALPVRGRMMERELKNVFKKRIFLIFSLSLNVFKKSISPIFL